MKTFRTYQLAVQFYRQSRGVQMPYHLKDQLLRAASSCALNLSEGSSRRSAKEQRRFFEIAYGSIRECISVLHLDGCDNSLGDLGDVVAAHCFKLLQHLNRQC